MISWRSIIPALIVAAVATMNVRADMVPAGKPRADIREPLPVVGQTSLPSASSLDRVLDLAGEVNFRSLPVAYSSGPDVDEGEFFGTQPVRLITDGRSSLNLFLYGLMSLGVFRSAVWMKKMSFSGLIPDWYHNGGPVQIGHKLAIGPDLRVPPICCFVQPDFTIEGCLPQYYHGTIVSLWRKSQFTPMVLAARGPPSLTN